MNLQSALSGVNRRTSKMGASWPGQFMGGGKFMGGNHLRTFKGDTSGGVLGEYTGTIKSFVDKTFYGFITCDDLSESGDVFLHGDEKGGYNVGDAVKFTAVMGQDGKVAAMN